MQFPRLVLLTVATALVVWLAFMLSGVLQSVGLEFSIIAVRNADAATLVCGTASCSSTSPKDDQFSQATPTWAVVAVRSTAATGDPRIRLFGDPGRTQEIASSNVSGNTGVDFVALDFHHTPAGTFYTRADRVSGSGEMCVQYDCATTTLALGSFNALWSSGQIVRAFNLPVTSNLSYRVALSVTAPFGSPNFGLAVLKTDGSPTAAVGRPQAITEADIRGADVGEAVLFKATSTDTVCVVVWSNTPGATASIGINVRLDHALTAGLPQNFGAATQRDHYFIPTQPQGWSVVALRPAVAADADLRLYTRPDFVSLLLHSSAEEGIVDFIVGNYANVPEDTAYVLMASIGPLGGYTMDWEYGMGTLDQGVFQPFSLLGRVGKSVRVQLTAGRQYQFFFEPTFGTTGDAALSVYGPTIAEPNFTYGTRADSLAGSDVWADAPGGWQGENGIETFLFTAPRSGEYLWYIYSKKSSLVTGNVHFHDTSLIGVGPGVPGLSLAGPWPSPCRMGTTVRFQLDLPTPGDVRASLYDARGRRVRDLGTGPTPAGPTSYAWDGMLEDGSIAAPGLYFARFEAAGSILFRRIVWLR
ncbi:MAG: FlgD immunoglobulin-like domain containing protein [Candidatus Eiseniibacteriota bacterium]